MNTRDMSKAEFLKALERNGFRNTVLGLWFEDTTGTTVTYGGIVTSKGKLLRRETIAHLIRSRDRIRKERSTPKPA